ncbi:MAG TPA: glycosyltransferase family 4 protein [Mucilaginibacter sp.]|nr:glycosyltransferase family 4 protein [Mucilaginibacter sp.]
MKLAIITTHPIQYYAPVFKLLHERQKISIMVFYTWGEGSVKKYDPGFGSAISWDIPLLDGYPYTWVKNTAADPGSHHYKGIINPGLIRQIQDWKADAVLVFGWAWQSHLKAMRFFKGRIPVYFRGDSTLLNEPKGIRKLIKTIFLKWVYSHVDHAFYVGVNNYEYYKRYGLKDGQLSFAPHAIDNGRFMQDHHTEARNLRTSLDLSEDDILVLYAGKFEQVKNLTLLLETFIRLNKPDVHLLLAGNGPEESVLKDMASRSQYIHFTGFKNQSYMPALYQACDLFCLPSFSETWGLAVNEAMACGRAVLVSDKVGCAPDLVKKEFNGAIFKSGDKDDLAGCLEKLTGSKNVLEQMGKKSAQMIEDWNFTHIAEAIENKLPAGENQDMG